MSFQDVAKAIVAEAITTAVCVDNEFAEPYSDELGDHDKPAALYRAFRAEKCTLDVYRYREIGHWRENGTGVLSGKDLLILDWELAEVGPVKYRDALTILGQAVCGGSIPFVYIYTQSPELEQVAYALRAHFSAPSAPTREATMEAVAEYLQDDLGIDPDTFFRRTQAEFFDLAVHHADADAARERIKEALYEAPDRGRRNKPHLYNEFLKVAAAALGIPKTKESVEQIEVVLGQCVRGLETDCHDGKVELTCVESIRAQGERAGRYTYVLERTLVRVVGKDAVPPHQIPADISTTIRTTPGRFLRLLSLEMRSLLRKSALRVANGLEGVDELAFFYHEKRFDRPETFEDFLKEMWKEQVGAFVMVQTPSLLTALEDYKAEHDIDTELVNKFTGGANTEAPLARLNYYYSSLQLSRRQTDTIRFGDIFEVLSLGRDDAPATPTAKYLLCITAHCDCLRPEKIYNQFMFVMGNEESVSVGLKAGDTGHLSFLEVRDRMVCVNWSTKPFTIHIKGEENHIGEIRCVVRGEEAILRHVGYQKDNYTQRVANQALSHAMRVGVDFARFPHPNADEAA